MYSIMASFLFWIMLIHKQDCAVIRMNGNNRNTFEYVIQKYMNPLRRLSADLPNHAIEMEIEIQSSIPKEETHIPQRRVIHVVNARHPKRVIRPRAREGDEKPQDDGAKDEAETETPAPPSVDPPTSPPPDQTHSDPSKIPVFMDDLNKAINELETKLHSKTNQKPKENSTEKQTENPTEKPTDDKGDKDKKAFFPSIQSIDDIMNILKKAQELNADVERKDPTIGDNVDWVRIKIPKRKS